MKKNKLVLNNKGYMLVETIVASVIAFVIAYFLIDITIKMVSKNDDFYLTSVLQTDQSLITKEIMDDFNNYTVTGVTCNSPVGGKCSSATISFKEIDPKTLSVSVSGRTVTYGSYTKTFDDTLEVGELSFYVNNEILYISLPAYTNYSDKNYGLNISVKYDPSIATIDVPKTKLIEVTEEVLEENKTTTTKDVDDIFYYTGNRQEKTYGPGTYKLEVWGAQGGDGYSDGNTSYLGGKGGYSYGTLTLDETTSVYVYVGGEGQDGITSSIKTGGTNGGGSSGYNRAGSGGGASDIRIGQDNLYARVIVAGGGGGGAYYSNYVGGYGGGTSGGSGSGNSSYSSYWAKAGTENSVGAAGGYSGYTGVAGSFGNGGNANLGSSTYNRSGGGGGGWYGGGGGGYRSSSSYYYRYISGGGGGSGYVYTSTTADSYPSGCLLDPKYYLDRDGNDAKTIAGDQSFTDFDGSSVTGHSGNGAARISGIAESTVYEIPRVTGLTPLSLIKGVEYYLLSDVRLIQADGETNGKFVSVNVDGVNVGASFILDTSSIDEGTHTINYIVQNEAGQQYSYARELMIIIESVIYESNSPGNSGAIPLDAGIYLLEVWGAQGGDGYSDGNTSYLGGKGGYSYGTLILDETTSVYVYVGGEGQDGTTSSIKTGGTNGGGSSGYNRAGSGGGASDIRIGQDNLYARVIVAGGGGGGAYYSNYVGGYGGGSSGSDGSGYNTIYNAKSGSQIEGGAAGGYSYYGTSGTFGKGGSASNINSTYNRSGGGGGGWYGGGGGGYRSKSSTYYQGVSGGGGGSGYVYTSSTASDYPSGCLLDSKYYFDRDGNEAGTIAGNQEFKDYHNEDSTVVGWSGDGAARITKIG